MNTWFFNLPRSVRLLLVVILYLAILAGHISLVYLYNNNFADHIETKPVVRVNQTLPPHTSLKSEYLTVDRVRLDDIVEGAYSSLDDVIGMETTGQMENREQVTPGKINQVIKKEGQMIVEIPSAWVLSFPQSLRRLDKIRLVPTLDSKDVKKAEETGVVTDPNQDSGTTQLEKALETKMDEVLIENPVIKNVTVAYFKDSSANDVLDPSTSTSAPRLQASSVGSKLEVAISPGDFDKVRALAEIGYKFVVGYE